MELRQPFSVTVPPGLRLAAAWVTYRPVAALRWAVAVDRFDPGASRTVVLGCRAAAALLTYRPVRAERFGMTVPFVDETAGRVVASTSPARL
ncbi:MAG: hypothetical protein LC775_16650 [Acidobacteria bacterium]|nr:hypothetical protein [Acidobacteriota bacterium]